MVNIIFVLHTIQSLSFNMKSVIIAKHILHTGEVIATGNFAKSGCFLKKGKLVIYYTAIVQGDEQVATTA